MTFRANELPADLRRIYLKFLDLDRRLEDKSIGPSEALRDIGTLKAIDAYDNEWTIDPASAQFIMTSPTGKVTTLADPARFHSPDGYIEEDISEEHLDDDVGFAENFTPSDDSDEDSATGAIAKFKELSLGKKILAGGAGLFLLLFVFGALSSVLGGGDTGTSDVGEVTEAGTPSTSEAAAAIGGLSRGDVAKTVPNATAVEAQWLQAQMTGLKAQQLILLDATTEEGGQLVVVNAEGAVVAKAPVAWVKEGQEWALAEVPVFQPATGEETPPTQDSAPGITIPSD